MENRNHNTQNVFEINQIEQLAIPGSMDVYQDIEYFDVTESDVYKDANFCLIPPYCLIEDKNKHLTAAG